MAVYPPIDPLIDDILIRTSHHAYVSSFFGHLATLFSKTQNSIHIASVGSERMAVMRILMPFKPFIPSDVQQVFSSDPNTVFKMPFFSLDDERVVDRSSTWFPSFARTFFVYGRVFFRMCLKYDAFSNGPVLEPVFSHSPTRSPVIGHASAATLSDAIDEYNEHIRKTPETVHSFYVEFGTWKFITTDCTHSGKWLAKLSNGRWCSYLLLFLLVSYLLYRCTPPSIAAPINVISL